MIDLSDIFLLFVFVVIVLFMWKGVALREQTLSLVARHLDSLGLQLLDQNIALRGFWFKRNQEGRFCAWRSYAFEFSSTGDDRYKGLIILLGKKVVDIKLEPYIVVEKENVLH